MAKSFLRIRPIGGCSTKDSSSAFFKIDDTRLECKPPTNSQCFKNNSKSNIRELKKKIFEFDKVLDEDCNQEQLYNECVQPLLTKFFDGENVLLFAYGTTSSGKTFTMRGDNSNPGVVPRCVNDIFESVQDKLMVLPMFKKTKFNDHEELNKFDLKKETELKSFIFNSVDDKSFCDLNLKSRENGFKSFLKDDENIRYIVWVSFFELYNDSLFDLLSVNNNSNCGYSINNSSINNNQPLKIMRDHQQNFFVNDLKQVYVNSANEAMKVYRFGIDNLKKHISSTAMNRTSSRSHSIFTISVITLKKKFENNFAVVHVNNFSLCDLAGQERNKKTQTAGVHLKEAGMINKTLLQLRMCIQAMKERKNNSSSQAVIPFTGSILTKIFQPYLSGSGLTFMIININPKNDNFDETLNSLEFSATASQVVPIRNESTNSLKEKMNRLTQAWLQSSRCWSKIEQPLNQKSSLFIDNDDLTLFKHPSATTTFKTDSQQSLSSLPNKTQDDNIIVDTQNVLSNQRFDCTYFEESITQKVREMNETIVEIEFYDEKFVEDLNNRIDDLEKQLANTRGNNLEFIHTSVMELYEKHEMEKSKIKERMNNLMDNRMKNLQEKYDCELEQNEKELENLNKELMFKENELENYKRSNQIHTEKIDKLNDQMNELKEIIKLNESEFNFKLQQKESEFNFKLQQKENEIFNNDIRHCVDNLLIQVVYEEKLDNLVYSNNNLTEQINLINLNKQFNNKEDQRNSTIIQQSITPITKSDKFNSDQHPINLIDFRSTTKDNTFNSKRSSLKRPFNFDYDQSPILFTANRQSITDEKRQSVDRLSTQLKKPLDLQSTLDESSIQHLNSTNQLLNADQLLNNIVEKNVENELELLKIKLKEKEKDDENKNNEVKELQIILDLKDEEIRSLKEDNKKLKEDNRKRMREMNRTIKEETASSISISKNKLTTELYLSVLNRTQTMNNLDTPLKRVAQLPSARKKRPIEEEPLKESENRYLDLIRNNEKSPTNDLKTTTKKKRTNSSSSSTTEPKRKARKEKKEDKIIEDKIMEEEKEDDDLKDDLIYFVEETTAKKKPGRKPRVKETPVSTRKMMPINSCRESFIFQDDDDIISKNDNKKTTRNTRRKLYQ